MLPYIGPYNCDSCGNPQPEYVAECVCCGCSNDVCNVCADGYGRCDECQKEETDCEKEAS